MALNNTIILFAASGVDALHTRSPAEKPRIPWEQRKAPYSSALRGRKIKKPK